MNKFLPYIIIGILLVVILFQNKTCKGPEPQKSKIDTVIKYVTVHDTILGKPLPPKVIKDTVWLNNPEYRPSEDCDTLKTQYINLGNKFFEKKIYTTIFRIKDYGSVTVIDSIKNNSLIYSEIITNLVIPEKTITKEEPIKPKSQLYLGGTLMGNPKVPVNGISANGLLRTKKDIIYGIGFGYNGDKFYSGSIYYPIRFK